MTRSGLLREAGTIETMSDSASARALPLEGVLVVSCEQAVAAPLATRHLADLGARVIKVERPGRGDFARDYDTVVHGLSSHFVWLNRSKESVTADLKDPDQFGRVRELIAGADVFVQNFAPGAAERLGLGADDLRRDHPGLIHCSISGYGSSGPYRDAKAYDLLIQAEAGLVSVTGTEEYPAKAGIPAADIGAGMYAFSGILAALYDRERTGEGAAFEVSLFDALSEWMGFPLQYAAGSGRAPVRAGTSHPAIAPYGAFAAGDGVEVVFGIQNEREWQRFCEVVLGDASVADGRPLRDRVGPRREPSGPARGDRRGAGGPDGRRARRPPRAGGCRQRPASHPRRGARPPAARAARAVRRGGLLVRTHPDAAAADHVRRRPHAADGPGAGRGALGLTSGAPVRRRARAAPPGPHRSSGATPPR